jgi:hypothetical protein
MARKAVPARSIGDNVYDSARFADHSGSRVQHRSLLLQHMRQRAAMDGVYSIWSARSLGG